MCVVGKVYICSISQYTETVRRPGGLSGLSKECLTPKNHVMWFFFFSPIPIFPPKNRHHNPVFLAKNWNLAKSL